MVASIHTNLMAANTARILGSHYDRLSKSVQRLSSGLRVNSAADDAAGLAIRELMRADVATLNQGIRNANDAISMIQVADGALGVIDEKLIRMKELSEQAATGTYNSTQRLMIDSEFQAMANEIDRIANATDFNGVKLLDGSLAGEHNGQGLQSTGKMKIHFGTGNDSAEDYYYVEIGDCTTVGLGLNRELEFPDAPAGIMWINDAQINYTGRQIILQVDGAKAGSGPAAFVSGMDFYQLPDGLKNVTITSNASEPDPFHKPHVNLFLPDGTQIAGVPLPANPGDPGRTWDPVIDDQGNTVNESVNAWWDYQTESQIIQAGKDRKIFLPDAVYTEPDPNLMNAGASQTFGTGDSQFTVTSVTGINEIASGWYFENGEPTEEIYEIDKITSGNDLVFFIGGHATGHECNCYNLTIEADITDTFLEKLKVWRGDESSVRRVTSHIDTQEKAQEMLVTINNAIAQKDTIRASLGALQNRLENTITNLSVQAENLQASESRISDTDVATEMTQFVRNQILTQSATAMLSQANSLPQMLMTLLNG